MCLPLVFFLDFVRRSAYPSVEHTFDPDVQEA